MGIVNFFTRLAWFVLVRRHLKVCQKFKKTREINMPPKSNNQKKKEAEAAGRPPKKTNQQENAGKTAAGKRRKCRLREQQKGKRSPEPGKSFEYHIPTKFIHVSLPAMRG